MGHGSYSMTNRLKRANKDGYLTKSKKDIFKNSRVHKDMNPQNVSIRESRDSDEHPKSLPIIIGLDVTGSMGSVPHYLVKNGLPNIMSNLMENDIKDPQILFLGIGDHKSDSAPLQISQFESSDELLDKWLTNVYLEGGGGRNGGESYSLAWYFASRHTSIDNYEKRNKKGILITIGDEPNHNKYNINRLSDLMGDNFKLEIEKEEDITFDDIWGGDWDDVDNVEVSIKNKKILTSDELLNDVKKMYDIYHIHVRQTKSGKIDSTILKWKEVLGDNLYVAETRENIAGIISNIIKKSNQ